MYVGNLEPTTTIDDIRAHLANIDVHGIAGVLSLGACTAEFASFRITVDNQHTEEALFQSSVWPEGTKVKSYMTRARRGPDHPTAGHKHIS